MVKRLKIIIQKPKYLENSNIFTQNQLLRNIQKLLANYLRLQSALKSFLK